MPEFILEGRDHAARAESEFVLGFIEAMFFTECSSIDSADWHTEESQEAVREGQADGCIPKDVGYTDLESSTLAAIRTFCNDKESAMADLLAMAYEREDYGATQAGRDLWYTFNGHGVGFWDREQLRGDDSEYERLTNLMTAHKDDSKLWDEYLAQRNNIQTLGDKLSEACGRGELNPFFDGQVHVEGF